MPIRRKLKVCATGSVNQRQMRLWHLLMRQVSKSDNPENLIILVQTTVRGQSTQSTPNTLVVFVPTLWEGNLSTPDLLSALKTPPTSIYGTKLTHYTELTGFVARGPRAS